MPNHAHFAKLLEGPSKWNRWRKEHPRTTPDLSGSELVSADFTGVDFSGVKLSGSDLNGSILKSADLSYADLSEADLGGSRFHTGNMRQSYFCERKLDRSQLPGGFVFRRQSDRCRLMRCRFYSFGSVGVAP